jgi:hypothetical protein
MHGADFMVFEVPSVENRTSFRPADRRLSASLPANLNVVSPIEAFTQYARPDALIYYERGAGHWTPLGNRLAAQVAFDAIEAHEYLIKPQAVQKIGSPKP